MNPRNTYTLDHTKVHQEDLCTANLLIDGCTPLEIGLVHLFVHYYLRRQDIYEHHKFNQAEKGAIKSLYEKGFLLEN